MEGTASSNLTSAHGSSRDALVTRGRTLTLLAVGMFIGVQAFVFLVVYLGNPAASLPVGLGRILAFTLVGYMAVKGRRWARWLIAFLAALTFLVFVMNSVVGASAFSLSTLMFALVITVGYAGAAVLLIVPKSVSEFFRSQRGGTEKGEDSS